MNRSEENKEQVTARRVRLTKVVRFEAAHQLPGHQGKCANLHGHSYILEVSVEGPIKRAPGVSDDGMVMDFQELSTIIQRSVLQRLDHQFLNDVIEERSTVENLACWIWDALRVGGLSANQLSQVRLWETATGYVDITEATVAHRKAVIR